MKIYFVLIIIFITEFSAIFSTFFKPLKEEEVQAKRRIYGGNPALIEQYPFVVIIISDAKENPAHFCAGAIINARWVMSSSKCGVGYTILYGHTKFGEGQYHMGIIRKCDVRDDVATEAGRRDLAIFLTISSFCFNAYVQPARLPNPSRQDIIYHTNFTISMMVVGWGKTETSNRSDVLLETSTLLGEKDYCVSRLSSARAVMSYEICGSQFIRPSGICIGDWGAPLVVPWKDTQIPTFKGMVYGIASDYVQYNSTAMCGIEGWPDVYSRVASFMKNIQNLTDTKLNKHGYLKDRKPKE